ncbi:unnamed protein product [Penicillium salamii]|uniref:Potassium channel domain-containing protein n=1 Tax=Penicillium salamii TaxID=1612424 RepID=A0A9W4NHI8_9EURO|nr:unnamed protein product [Penicillium salamii]CAG8066742.1 unnamed protein product [Penicillium salamii]CAG8073978.1 unnamed protein product [Penicillium salamii]CAG8173632.1 unnamed protein product [Penicillium salamii]CAG8226670.1 unnamed protein product [Penicillium salamii]
MNDPGLDDAIADEAVALDEASTNPKERTGPDGKPSSQYPQAARWWLASTAYPLMAGTFGPMASAFNICSLSQPWRMDLTSGGGLDIPDPKWVTSINAVSLVSALIANLALSLNMARRIRFEIAQPIIVIGWYISSALLIGILIPFGVLMYKPENDGRIYSQSYYHGTFAAGIYFIISSLMTVTGYGAWRDHYSREYNLTTSQRTLMLQTIIFFIYLLGGAAVYARIEHWRFLDAVYWADYTLLTIGVGNFAPTTHLGRGLLFPYAVGGIIILGLIISSIRTLMLEKGRQKIGDILTAHTHKFLVKEAFSNHSRLQGIVPPLDDQTAKDEGRSDREQRKREFIAMRQVRQLATIQHKWLSLLMSFTLWMTMWLIGGVVFWRSESDAQWSYFQALYFAYTTLLTIGYGDIYPVSSLGKSFFVFWSLLAVPTITILISSIGDTLVRFIRDITLFIGEITILPGDQSFIDRTKDLTKVSWTGWWLEETTGEKRKQCPDENMGDRPPLEAEEKKKENEAQARGDVAAENIHHYHYLLFREVRKLMEQASSNPAREFDYVEWEYYLGLIGGKNRPSISGDEHGDAAQAKTCDWDWLDKKSPLLGRKSEVEWLLGALTETLDQELQRASDMHPSVDKPSKYIDTLYEK